MQPTRISDAWERGSGYEQYVGRWSRQVAPRFLSWLNVRPGLTWLDVGCGTGALAAAILDHCAPAKVIGVEPSAGFLHAARQNLAGRATLHSGSATHIPLRNDGVDIVVSALVLNFVDDPRAALTEMARVSRRDGVIAAYVWDYADKMELMRHFWDVAVDLEPAAAQLHEGIRFPLCQPGALTKLFVTAGLADVAVVPIDIATTFADFHDYWRPFLAGQGPAPAYAMSLGDAARARLRDTLAERVPTRSDGTIAMTARAWAVRGNVRRST